MEVTRSITSKLTGFQQNKMSIIRIKRRADPISRPYEIAKKIKQRWTGDEEAGVKKAEKDTILDLGDEFCGRYGQIDTIELNDKPRAPQLQPEQDRPMTEEEKVEARKFFQEMRLQYPFLVGGKDIEKLTVSRSGMAEYKRLTGKDYKVPNGTEIIEDIT